MLELRRVGQELPNIKTVEPQILRLVLHPQLQVLLRLKPCCCLIVPEAVAAAPFHSQALMLILHKNARPISVGLQTHAASASTRRPTSSSGNAARPGVNFGTAGLSFANSGTGGRLMICHGHAQELLVRVPSSCC